MPERECKFEYRCDCERVSVSASVSASLRVRLHVHMHVRAFVSVCPSVSVSASVTVIEHVRIRRSPTRFFNMLHAAEGFARYQMDDLFDIVDHRDQQAWLVRGQQA